MRGLLFRTALLVVALWAPLQAKKGEPPPPLSAEPANPRIESTYGSGNFGVWFTDRFGLPAYRYEIDQEADARAQQSELNGDTRAQHQLGNDHIVANAYNHGYTQLWSQARL